MIDSELESEILLKNAEALGIDLIAFFDEVGSHIAQHIIKHFNKKTSYGVVCGKGGNAADGLATAYHLSCNGVKNVTVYLVGRNKQFTNPITQDIFDELYEFAKKEENITIKQDCFAKDIENHDVFVEALVGTGLEGVKLSKRFRDVVKRMVHFKKPIVAIDIPTPHYTPDRTYSLMYPKTNEAYTVTLELPQDIRMFCGPGEKEALWEPNKKTHKTKNGKLLYIAQNDTNNQVVIDACNEYATNLSIFTFEHLTDNVTTKKRITSGELTKLIEESDAILFGDIPDEIVQYATIKHIMQQYHSKPFVFTGTSVSIIDMLLLSFAGSIGIVIEPSKLKSLFKDKSKSGTNTFEGKARRFAIQNNVHICLPGSNTSLYGGNGEMKRVKASKSNQFKIAALTAAYSTKNDLWLSMRATVA
jgi:hydroxyethylthiazole kinase-like uncharacterized protein yjeF